MSEVNDDQEFIAYRGTLPVGTDACEAAHDAGAGNSTAASVSGKCETASTFSVLQWVFFAAGGAALGGGAYLFFTDEDATPSAEPKVTAKVNPSGAELGVKVAF